MDRRLVTLLRCPVCGGGLTERATDASSPRQRVLGCANGHDFDIAKQGYVDLSGGRVRHQGDTADMVTARQELLAAGHLAAVTAGLIAAAPERATGAALDVGAGTGHHLAGLLDARPGLIGLAVDVSKPALRRAARAHPRMGAVRADVWRGLPVADGAFELVLDVFAPRSGPEFHRVLHPGGSLIVVTPCPDHLGELVSALGLLTVDPSKSRRLADGLEPWFELVTERVHQSALSLSPAAAASAVLMGPSAWHLDPERVTTTLAASADPVAATLSVRVSRWRRRSVPAGLAAAASTPG